MEDISRGSLSDRDLQFTAQNIGSEWHQLGIMLGYQNTQLGQLDQMFPHSVQQKFLRMLTCWRDVVEGKGENSRLMLSAAFIDINNIEMAERITQDMAAAEKYRPRPGTEEAIKEITFDLPTEQYNRSANNSLPPPAPNSVNVYGKMEFKGPVSISIPGRGSNPVLPVPVGFPSNQQVHPGANYAMGSMGGSTTYTLGDNVDASIKTPDQPTAHNQETIYRRDMSVDAVREEPAMSFGDLLLKITEELDSREWEHLLFLLYFHTTKTERENVQMDRLSLFGKLQERDYISAENVSFLIELMAYTGRIDLKRQLERYSRHHETKDFLPLVSQLPFMMKILSRFGVSFNKEDLGIAKFLLGNEIGGEKSLITSVWKLFERCFQKGLLLRDNVESISELAYKIQRQTQLNKILKEYPGGTEVRSPTHATPPSALHGRYYTPQRPGGQTGSVVKSLPKNFPMQERRREVGTTDDLKNKDFVDNRENANTLRGEYPSVPPTPGQVSVDKMTGYYSRFSTNEVEEVAQRMEKVKLEMQNPEYTTPLRRHDNVSDVPVGSVVTPPVPLPMAIGDERHQNPEETQENLENILSAAPPLRTVSVLEQQSSEESGKETPSTGDEGCIFHLESPERETAQFQKSPSNNTVKKDTVVPVFIKPSSPTQQSLQSQAVNSQVISTSSNSAPSLSLGSLSVSSSTSLSSSTNMNAAAESCVAITTSSDVGPSPMDTTPVLPSGNAGTVPDVNKLTNVSGGHGPVDAKPDPTMAASSAAEALPQSVVSIPSTVGTQSSSPMASNASGSTEQTAMQATNVVQATPSIVGPGNKEIATSSASHQKARPANFPNDPGTGQTNSINIPISTVNESVPNTVPNTSMSSVSMTVTPPSDATVTASVNNKADDISTGHQGQRLDHSGMSRCCSYGRIEKMDESIMEDYIGTNPEEIGRGGFGTVYLAKKRHKSGIRVVIKKMEVDDPEMWKAFVREKLAGRVLHPFIVPVIAVAEMAALQKDGVKICYVMYPYMENKDLATILKCNPQMLGFQSRIRIMFQVASGLLYLHTPVLDFRGAFCHRDLASANIFLDENQNARIGDLGLAREQQKGKSGITASTAVGRREYNVHDNTSIYKVKVTDDVFSFGVVILELLTNKPPLIGIGVNQKILWKQYDKPRERVTKTALLDDIKKAFSGVTIRKTTKDKLIELALGALKKKENDRICLTQMTESLEKILNEENTSKWEQRSSPKKCLTCMVNDLAPYPPKGSCSAKGCKQTLCISCMKNRFLNPLICPRHGEITPPIGENIYGVFIAGNDVKKKESAETFARDARYLRQILTSHYPNIAGIKESNIRLICPERPGIGEKMFPEVEKEFNTIIDLIKKEKEEKKIEGDSVFLFFYSGHNNKSGFLMGNPDEIICTRDMRKLLRRVEVRTILTILDCCDAGAHNLTPDEDDDDMELTLKVPSLPMKDLKEKKRLKKNQPAAKGDEEDVKLEDSLEEDCSPDNPSVPNLCDIWAGAAVAKGADADVQRMQLYACRAGEKAYNLEKSFFSCFLCQGLQGNFSNSCFAQKRLQKERLIGPSQASKCDICEKFHKIWLQFGYIDIDSLFKYIDEHIELLIRNHIATQHRPNRKSDNFTELKLAYYLPEEAGILFELHLQSQRKEFEFPNPLPATLLEVKQKLLEQLKALGDIQDGVCLHPNLVSICYESRPDEMCEVENLKCLISAWNAKRELHVKLRDMAEDLKDGPVVLLGNYRTLIAHPEMSETCFGGDQAQLEERDSEGPTSWTYQIQGSDDSMEKVQEQLETLVNREEQCSEELLEFIRKASEVVEESESLNFQVFQTHVIISKDSGAGEGGTEGGAT